MLVLMLPFYSDHVTPHCSADRRRPFQICLVKLLPEPAIAEWFGHRSLYKMLYNNGCLAGSMSALTMPLPEGINVPAGHYLAVILFRSVCYSSSRLDYSSFRWQTSICNVP